MKKEDIILQYLKESEDYLSGEELSRRLGISRSTIWKNIDSLRESSYVIESVTNRGYRILSSSDALTPTEIQSGLSTEAFGQTVSALAEVDSTNEEAKRQAHKGTPHGAVFMAGQRNGRKGRLGRPWQSPPGSGLWFTILLRLDAVPPQVSNLTLLAGLTVSRAIHTLTGCEAKIKWSDDIVIGSKRVCGILAEMTIGIDRIHFAVVGIGVNVDDEGSAEELKIKATSLHFETGAPISRVTLLQQILKEFEAPYLEYFIEGSGRWLQAYKESCALLNRTVGATREHEKIIGTAVGITDGGEPVVQASNGERIEINSGEVVIQGIYGQTPEAQGTEVHRLAIYDYKSKEELLDTIDRNYRLFDTEFEGVPEEDKDLRLPEVDKTPAEMLVYQIGWLPPVRGWDKTEPSGQTLEVPAPGYKQNRLGKLYAEFYRSSGGLSLRELRNRLAEEEATFVGWVTNLAEQELFVQGARRWTDDKLDWSMTRWIHINSAASFQAFRSKIRKWKRVRAAAAARAAERE